jgi:uncharacterized membrane protein YbhN (UPF0104 family)
MTYNLRSITPSTLARILALVVGGLMLIFSLMSLPIFLFMPFPKNDPSAPPKALFLVLVILYPLFGAIWGWVAGQISARLYNFAAKRIGGVSIELVPSEPVSQETA